MPLNCPGHEHRSSGPRLGAILASEFWRSRIWGPTCDRHLVSPTETPSDSDHKKKKKKKEEDPERKRKKKEKKKKKVRWRPVQAARESPSRPGPRESRLLFSALLSFQNRHSPEHPGMGSSQASSSSSLR